MRESTLYHTGFQTIAHPDVHYGRKNADFGQGFYLTDDQAFAHRWAKMRKDEQVILNRYTLNTEGLRILTFGRDETWYDYIFRNRSGYLDLFGEYDLIIGPIANDTIFDTMGVITSGFLSSEEALKLLSVGPAYTQYALKTEKAASQLQFLSSDVLSSSVLQAYSRIHLQEQEEYLKQFAEVFESFQ